ncbi:Uma2 family endonuclease [Streptomyces vilmorinianum]|uniref:Uma2 family endonuclease n=1 Tax=Streptomyces vilmorinianum TaxID=3051092 RepID=UPI0010FB6F44|nr:Uma2 family endonuclease [Streptomyces vilmorinianum]
MTAVDDRIEMAETSGERPTLDEMFEALERMPVPEGYRVEIVEGDVFMTPQRSTHWEIIREILWALGDKFGRRARVFSDVRIDFPGGENGFCPDVAKLSDEAVPDSRGHWDHADVEFVAEVISKGTARNDYEPKKAAYATAEVPVYLIADPYQGRCHVYTEPKDGQYVSELVVDFGADLDLSRTPLGLVLKTDGFPRE